MKWRIVPLPPTPEQIELGWKLIMGNLRPDEIYHYLIKAAPPYVPSEADIDAVARAIRDDLPQSRQWHELEPGEKESWRSMARAAGEAFIKSMTG